MTVRLALLLSAMLLTACQSTTHSLEQPEPSSGAAGAAESGFAAWRTQLKAEAMAAGVSAATFDRAFRGARTKVNGEMVDAYDAFIGGRLGKNRRFNELLKGKIIAKDVHLFIDKVLRVFDSMKQDGETFADFTDRVPKEQILAALEKP